VTYREMPDVLGESERDEEATRAFGKWRDRTKTICLLIGAVVGFVGFAIGYWTVQELQFRYNSNIAFVKINVLGGMAAWAAVFFASAMLARVVIARRTPAKIAELSAAYEIPADKLLDIANMLRKL
jgi:hypothetical protein